MSCGRCTGIYNGEAMANAIAKGLTGEVKGTVTQPVLEPTPQPVPTPKDDWIRLLQTELNNQIRKGLVVDGISGPKTLNACPQVKKGLEGILLS